MIAEVKQRLVRAKMVTGADADALETALNDFFVSTPVSGNKDRMFLGVQLAADGLSALILYTE